MNSTTTQSPTVVLFDWTAYLRMSFCLIGVISNLVNLSVFLSPELKDASYKFMMIKTISNIVYLSVAITTEILSYCSNCSWNPTYFAQLFFIIGGMVLPGLLTVFRLLIELSVSVYTSFILINRPWPGNYTHIWVILACIALSVGFYMPNAFYYTVIMYDTDMYTFWPTSFYGTNAARIITLVQMFTRVVLTILIIPSINFLNLVMFKKRFQNGILPTKLSGYGNTDTKVSTVSKRASQPVKEVRQAPVRRNTIKVTQNITRMVIVSLLVNAVGQLPFSISYILQNFKVVTGMFQVYSIFLLYFWQSFDLLIYYFFNKLFRSVLNDYVKSIRKFIC